LPFAQASRRARFLPRLAASLLGFPLLLSLAPNEGVSGAASPSNNPAGDAPWPENRHDWRAAQPRPLNARLGRLSIQLP